MGELKALNELGAALGPPTGTPPEHLRHRVMAETLGQPGRRSRFARTRPTFLRPALRRPALPRLAWRVGVAGGLAAVLTGGFLVSQVLRVGDREPASTAEAAQILRSAAGQAQRQPVVTVRGDMFVYVESVTATAKVSAIEGTPGGGAREVSERRIWQSADGTRDGLLRTRPRADATGWREQPLPGCRAGQETATKGGTQVRTPCTPLANYRAELPTNPDDMLAHLYRTGGGTKNPRHQEAFTAAADLIREAYLSPAALAAVFGALAKIPSVTVVGDVVDEAGRTGVAVTLTEVQGSRAELIFDRRSFAFLGERSVAVDDRDGRTAGQVLNSTAVLKVAVVDRVGQQG